MKNFPDLPPIWLLGFLALNWVFARAIPGNPGAPVLNVLSWGLIGLGLLLILWAAFWFWRRKTTIEPHHEPDVLIAEGPFRFSRNPIYLAMLMILLGAVIGRGQPLCLILLPFFYGILMRRFVFPEEEMLRRRFGSEAETYLASTRRWF